MFPTVHSTKDKPEQTMETETDLVWYVVMMCSVRAKKLELS